MSEDSDELVPHEVVEALINWMLAEGYSQVHLVSRALPARHGADPVRDETRALLYCDSEPDHPALLNAYVVTDDQGLGRHNGPSSIPQHVLRPLLRALDRASVRELVVAAAEETEPSVPPTLTVTRLDDFEEHEVPAEGMWPVYSVQVPRGGVTDDH